MKEKKLSKKEQLYFDIMNACSGVLYITSKPGTGKSAILESIASKTNRKYIPIYLSMRDETDVGLYPIRSTYKDRECLEHIVPKWALIANEQPSIIHFEELPRAPLSVRNAALGILLERQIDFDFKFNDDVLMVASGNLGEEDGTDVDEFDAALNNRLIHYRHELELEEWIEEFANDNVHQVIINYVRSKPTEFYKRGKDDDKAYASPRTWAMLSNFIISKYGKDSEIDEFYDDLIENDVVKCYIGSSATSFYRYLENWKNVNINDIIKRFDSVKEQIETNRSKKSELLIELKQFNLQKFKKQEFNNILKFLQIIDDDERIGYFTFLLDQESYDENSKEGNTLALIRTFKDNFLFIATNSKQNVDSFLRRQSGS